MDELRGVALKFRSIPLQQPFESLARFRPVFPQKGDLREIEPRVPEFRISRERLLQRGFRLSVIRLAHQDHTAQILGLRQVRLARIDRVELF